jgi:ribonuclease PH
MPSPNRSRRRSTQQIRPVTIVRHYATAAPGSVLIEMGRTRVLCTASVSPETPPWLLDVATSEPAKGWVTAEYAMLPGSTPDRKRRGADSRGTEIQRLIGRSLRAAVDLRKMAGITITCDCDVLCADGGTRTAAITGAYVALADAMAHCLRQKWIPRSALIGPVAAVSVGIVEGRPVLDLDYALDVRAQVDLNVVMNHRGQLVEVQGTAEQEPFDRRQLNKLLDLAGRGIRQLIRHQRRALRHIS